MFCPACGKNNPEDSSYCSKCGAYLAGTRDKDETTITFTPLETETEQEEVIKIPEKEIAAGGALLVVKRGPSAGTRFVINKDTVIIGRHPESDIFLDDITVSRRHAEIRRVESKFFLTDQGSLNGTYVNKMRVDETEIVSGDEIQIGKFKLVFFCK